MVRHIILWKLKPTETPEETKAAIKAGLEGLDGQIPGMLYIRVQTDTLPSSSADLMLDSAFADAAALAGYQAHPAHVNVATTVVRPNVDVRLCMDYEAE